MEEWYLSKPKKVKMIQKETQNGNITVKIPLKPNSSFIKKTFIKNSGDIHEPRGLEYFLEGISIHPKISESVLRDLSRQSGANPLMIIIKDYENETINYVLQEESHILIRYNKRNSMISIDDFTCGTIADPRKISPRKNPSNAKIFNLAWFSEYNHKRGERSLGKNSLAGNHFLCDVYDCPGKMLNDGKFLEKILLDLHEKIVKKNPDEPVIYEFKDEVGKTDGFSGAVISGNSTDERAVISFHTYPFPEGANKRKNGVIMIEINYNFFHNFFDVLQNLKETFKTDDIDYRTLIRNYYAF
jgi:S-adenosylmethionine/arginine decarboxylase-like enzyme